MAGVDSSKEVVDGLSFLEKAKKMFEGHQHTDAQVGFHALMSIAENVERLVRLIEEDFDKVATMTEGEVKVRPIPKDSSSTSELSQEGKLPPVIPSQVSSSDSSATSTMTEVSAPTTSKETPSA